LLLPAQPFMPARHPVYGRMRDKGKKRERLFKK
jgi:hypothetical protein